MVSTVIPPELRNPQAPQGAPDTPVVQDPTAAAPTALPGAPEPTASPMGGPTQAQPTPAPTNLTPPAPVQGQAIDLSKQSNDDLLGPEPKLDLSKSNDDLLGPEPSAWQSTKNALPYMLGGGSVGGDVARDQFFRGTGAGRILDAFGQGAKENWGSEPLGLSAESEKWLQDVGILTKKDENVWNSPIKAFNDAIIKPLAVVSDLAMRAPMAVFGAGARGVGQSAEELGASPTANEQISQDLNIAPFAFGDVAISTPHPEAPALPRVLQEAQDLKVIGPEGEAGWKGSPVAAPEGAVTEEKGETPAQQSAIADTAEAAKTADETKTAPEPPKPTVDDVARRLEPSTMDQWTALQTRRDSYRTWLNDFAQERAANAEINSPHAAEITDLTDQISALQARMEDTTPRLAKKYQARIDDFQSQLADAQTEHDKFVQDFVSQDSPDMARVRQALMQTDFRMRDMAPAISDLYRRAQDAMQPVEQTEAPQTSPAEQAPQQPAEAVQAAPVQPATPEPQKVAPVPAEAIQPTGEAPNVVGGETGQTIGNATTPDHISQIEQDVTDRLTKAGRPSDEAAASASIIAAHYEARASRFSGEKGNALDLYKSEAPEVATGGNKGKRGTIRVVEGQKPIIRLMQDADASTFMHETGHAWLEELMSDAKTEGVHDSVKQDAQTVRDWLGNDGSDLTRAQHEKFAKAFEQYLFTGQAPMARLANVFAQFRDWLSTVYNAATGRGVKVSEDIRDVFDRLISANPERQPVLTKEPVGKMLADIHEADAEHTPASLAHETGDSIEQEMGNVASANPPLGDDVSEGIPGALGSGDQDTAALGREGEEAGNPVAGSGGSPASSSEVGGGAREASSEGAGPRNRAGEAEAERAEGETAVLTRPTSRLTTEVPTSPHEVFEPERKPEQYFDKAGNIRLENLNRPEDIKNVLRITAEDNNGFMEQRGGVQTLVDQQATADALGLTADNFRPNRPPGVSESTWLRAVRDLTLRSATDVRDLMVAARDSGSDADAAAFGKALARHTLIQGEFSRAKAESGRALAANRWDDARAMVEGVGNMAQEATGMTLNQLKNMARDGAALETPGQVSKFVNEATKPGFRDKAMFWVTNGLISGLDTHSVYEAAAIILAMERTFLEKPLAAAYGSAAEMLGRNPEAGRVYWGEVGASMYGMVKGIPEGVSAGIKAFKSNVSARLPGEDFVDIGQQHRQPIEGPVGTVIGSPGRLVTALHSFNRNVFYAQRIQELAVREASDLGLSGDALARKVTELTSSPTEAMMNDAIETANRNAYMKKPDHGTVAQKVESLANSNIYTKFTVPFARVSQNIIREAVQERSMIGLLSERVRDNLTGKNGAAIADEQRASLTAGVLIGGAMVGWYLQGRATGYGPSDPNERRLWLVDHQPYSIRVGDTWVSYGRLGHLGMLMKMGTGLGDSLHDLNEKGVTAGIIGLGHATMHSIVDETPLVTISNLVKIMEERPSKSVDPTTGVETEEPSREAQRALFSMMQEPIPFSSFLRQTANWLDPNQREVHGFKESVQNIIPFWRNELPPRRDVWGEPVPSNQSFVTALAAAPFQDRIRDDPTAAELMRLGVYPTAVPQKLRGIQLTPEQHDDLARVSGRLMKTRLDQIIAAPGWAQMPDSVKTQVAHEMIKGSRSQAGSAILMQYPQIIQDAVNAKLRKFQ